MNDEEQRLSIEEILATDPAPSDQIEDPLATYPEVTTRALAILSLQDCKEQLDRWNQEPLRLVQAAKSAHLALQAALVDALAGSASIGAFEPKLQAAYLEYFEKSRDEEASPPASDKIMNFSALLRRAIEQPLEWSGRKLDVSAEEHDALDKLTMIRDRIEHPRPHSHFFQPMFVARTIPTAARLTKVLLDECCHHYSEGQREALAKCVAEISHHCASVKQ